MSHILSKSLVSTVQPMLRLAVAIALATVVSLGGIAQTPTTTSAGKSDSEIRQCIENRLASSEKLGGQGFSVAVTNREATLTGTARNSGSKGAVTRIARTCGADKVSNLITAPSPQRSSRKDSRTF